MRRKDNQKSNPVDVEIPSSIFLFVILVLALFLFFLFYAFLLLYFSLFVSLVCCPV